MTGIGRIARAVTLLTVALAGGCREAPTAPFPELPYIEGDPAARRVEWEARGITDYDFRLHYWNEWIEVPEVRVEVRDGVVVRLVEIESGAVITGPEHPCWRTVDDLYGLAEDLMAEPENVQLLRFHSKYDYVRDIWFNAPEMADEAYSYSATSFAVR